MSFNRMKYTPEDGLKNMIAFPMVPVNEDAAREQFQRLFDQVTMQVNTLMAALENAQVEYSAARSIGCEPVSMLEGGGETIFSQLEALSVKLQQAIQGEMSIGEIIHDNDIKTNMLEAGAITSDKLANGAVTGDKLSAGAISGEKLGVMKSITLDLRPDVGADKKDSLDYDAANRKLKLSIAGMTSAQLAPVVYGTSATISGSYPAGTIYVQYVE